MATTALLDMHVRSDRAGDAPTVIEAILRDTRAFEGCLGVEVLVDVEDPTHVTVVEHWRSLDRDDAYRAWRATPEGASGLGDLLDRPPVLSRYATQTTL
ncbi:MAG TPA: antibiotic biosynthesis monooxygenase family protein [Amnibacterium sp.]|nr:antibiotic biosynthesis monooxygenase family protein [Amnibacterium sp.]